MSAQGAVVRRVHAGRAGPSCRRPCTVAIPALSLSACDSHNMSLALPLAAKTPVACTIRAHSDRWVCAYRHGRRAADPVPQRDHRAGGDHVYVGGPRWAPGRQRGGATGRNLTGSRGTKHALQGFDAPGGDNDGCLACQRQVVGGIDIVLARWQHRPDVGCAAGVVQGFLQQIDDLD